MIAQNERSNWQFCLLRKVEGFSQQDRKNLLQSDSRRQEFPHSLNPISNLFSTKYEVYLKIKLQNTAVIKGVEKNKFLSFFARIYFRMT